MGNVDVLISEYIHLNKQVCYTTNDWRLCFRSNDNMRPQIQLLAKGSAIDIWYIIKYNVEIKNYTCELQVVIYLNDRDVCSIIRGH